MVELSPERAIEIQALLGADIPCSSTNASGCRPTRDEIARAMQLSLRWAERCKRAFEGARATARRCSASCRAATIMALRAESARALADIGFDGYAIGGLAVGEPQEVMFEMVDDTAPMLPADRPRYLMGVGTPDDHAGRGGARHRHVRLRAADPQRPPRPGFYAFRHDQSVERAPRRRSAPARRKTARMPGGARPIPAPICII